MANPPCLKADTAATQAVLRALRQVRRGRFGVRIRHAGAGPVADIIECLNDIFELQEKTRREAARIAEVVGKEGRVAQRASIGPAPNGWADYIDSINSLISDLAQPTTDAARVIGAVARGDLSRRMPTEIDGRPLKGVFLQIAGTVNIMVAQLGAFASEVTRVAREVGTEGKLGGQADVKGLGGIWADLTHNVNLMASNLTNQVRNIAAVTTAVANGDLSQKITVEVRGEVLQLKNTINTMVDQLRSFASEVTRVAREVGTEGKLGSQAEVKEVAGVWKDLTSNVNLMASNLTAQVRNIAEVTKAVAQGDLSKKITVDVRGEILELKNTINIMVDQLNSFAAEVTRVAREVGTEGKLGGQAEVKGVAGVWKDLTNNVNLMAANLTSQVRNIADVTTAVANGDLSRKITVEVQGEILALKNTINTMVDQLNAFASEVTRVAREVGFEGKLGGQARVKGAAGVWKDLTNNVNFMAGNLTSQVRNINEVTRAIAKGDLSKKITVEVQGEILQLKNTINSTVDLLKAFASETTRVAREVGTEGKLGGQAKVKGVAGVWKDLTNNVNLMARNITSQVRSIAKVNKAIGKGDLSKKITIQAKGEMLGLKHTINDTVDLLNDFASEVTRVAREVGTEGKLGGQAEVKGVAGVWKDLTNNVNFMASNLTSQVRNIAEVTKAVAKGDLSKKITVDVRGEILALKNTINIMVDQLNSFAAEVTRVAREVGTEGKLGGQAKVPGVAGVWKGLTDNVNSMASNLTGQVRNIADVTTAVANGDLSRKITVEVQGEILALKNTINTMVDQLRSFSSEVTRVAREVGVEGKLGGQAEVMGVAGVWKDLTNNVNLMASNLTNQVRNIAAVTTAVAEGDFSQKITVAVQGELLQLKNTINTMVDQLRSFASEVTRVAREVGTEGKLGGQAEVEGVAGAWKDLTDRVNFMASSLTSQVRNIAEVTTAIAKGDLSKKITVDVRGEILELKNTINIMVDQLNSFASEVTRVAREVGTEGKLGGQAQVKGVAGVWKNLTDNVNSMASNLTSQVRNIADVTTAVAKGDLTRKITVKVKGEILQLKNTINTMVDQLNSFASEVTRVAREVGTEGKLGGQAEVKGVAGVWKDLTDNVNGMAFNLTNQVRRIAKVVTAVAGGNLKQKLPLEARGEIATLADTINDMIDTLATFAAQVTDVAREVGVEGRLGGQARVPGATGIWRDLTDNVNQLAANLTGQVRAIAEVSTSVTKGDLTRSITVQAHGEVAALKDNINAMIENLRQTTKKNAEQDWLKSNLARFGRMLQGQRDVDAAAKLILSELAPLVSAELGVFYVMDEQGPRGLRLITAYGHGGTPLPARVEPGSGLLGQAAVDKRLLFIEHAAGRYARIDSIYGRGEAVSAVIFPVLFEGEVKAVVELASFGTFSPIHLTFIEQLAETIGIVLNTITSTTRTEGLLAQSQSLSQELSTRQDELQRKNQELEDRARLLSEQKKELEAKNREIEIARSAIEEKAEQVALTSKYKSQFLANMSHELRTPLNSLLILARSLSQNTEKNLTAKQVEFAETIHSSGNELLLLINDILDLSKIESGTMSIETAQVGFAEISDYAERNFRELAEEKGLAFGVMLAGDLPDFLATDAHRLKQILRNLLSNAIKFTASGRVSLDIGLTSSGWSPEQQNLSAAKAAVAFTVRDTGIGIPREKQRLIFEEFQQVDMTTSRKYGGTGLGLSISRRLADLLGGEIVVESEPGKGSAFTLFLPYTSAPAPAEAAPSEPAALNGEPVEAQKRSVGFKDDRESIRPGDKVVLVVTGDLGLSQSLLKVAKGAGFKAYFVTRSEAVLASARKIDPFGILLDFELPDFDARVVLDRLKHDAQLRHIPVVLLASSEQGRLCLRQGAYTVLRKPVPTRQLQSSLSDLLELRRRGSRDLLLVESDVRRARELEALVASGQVRAVTARSGRQALEMLRERRFDCMVLGPKLPDQSPAALVKALHAAEPSAQLPIVLDGSDALPAAEARALKGDDRVALVAGRETAPVVERVSLFLHQDERTMPEGEKAALRSIFARDPALAGKSVLIVDDDARNVFALSSVLERSRMRTAHAENGRLALEVLRRSPETDLVLMDVMMPEMDGYTAMQEIRKMPRFKELPIIALTAKALKGDRDKCLAAGASDYIPKPVEVEQLLSLLRVWLAR